MSNKLELETMLLPVEDDYITKPFSVVEVLARIKVAIVASFVIVCFTQGQIGSAILANNMTFYAILFAAAVVSVWRVETRDVMYGKAVCYS